MDEITKKVHEILMEVPDPEVPALSVVDLGIIRNVSHSSQGVEITVTPTYSGCPAMQVIEESIVQALRQGGFQDVSIKTVLLPAWTTDWISQAGREKLKQYGIAPPGQASDALVAIGKPRPVVPCPFCDSRATKLKSEFGSTACKSLYVCADCKQPFEHFKPH